VNVHLDRQTPALRVELKASAALKVARRWLARVRIRLAARAAQSPQRIRAGSGGSGLSALSPAGESPSAGAASYPRGGLSVTAAVDGATSPAGTQPSAPRVPPLLLTPVAGSGMSPFSPAAPGLGSPSATGTGTPAGISE